MTAPEFAPYLHAGPFPLNQKVTVLPRSVSVLRVSVLVALLWPGVGVADQVPHLDLDDPTLARSAAPSRTRWYFEPRTLAADELDGRALASGLDVIGRLDRFGGIWILEGEAGREDEIESEWSAYGELRRDVRGTPALTRSTRAVAADPALWEDLDLKGDPTASVAILDSGCDTAHDDLGDPDGDDLDGAPAAGDADDWRDVTDGFPTDFRLRVVGWHDVTDDLPGAVGPWDYHYHGTAMASAAFGSGRAEVSGRGVAPRGRFVVVKTWNFEDRWEVWSSDLLLGLHWVLDNVERLRIRACVVGATWPEDIGFGPVVDQLRAAGVIVVAPAGNDPALPMGYPARTPGVFTVGATDAFGSVASYSTPGPADAPLGPLDLLAPGGSAIAPDGGLRVADNEPQDGYVARVGTSLAAAHVAGAISVLSETWSAGSRVWRPDAMQVGLVEDLLRATAAWVPGAEASVELPSPAVPGPDRTTGHGILQVAAAVDAVRNIVWPGDEPRFTLDAPADGRAVWAARVPVGVGRPLRFELEVPVAGDFDLHVHRENADGLDEIGTSRRRGVGLDETLEIDFGRRGDVIVVVRRIEGAGTATFRVRPASPAFPEWPVQMSAPQVTSPTVYDVDGDGVLDVLAVNNLQAFPDVHSFFAIRPDGSDVGVYPEQFFTPGRAGELRVPALGRFGAADAFVAGSEIGQVLAVERSGALRWIRGVNDAPTTSAVLLDPGADARAVVGTSIGLVGYAPDGTRVLDVPASSAVTRPPAAGDLDGDGRDEIVWVEGAGRVHASDGDGTPLSGWPRQLAGNVGAPVLVGDGTGSRVVEIAVVEIDAQSRAVLHRWRPDGTQAVAPLVLETEGRAVASVSPLVATPAPAGEPVTYVVASLVGVSGSVLDMRVHLVRGTDAPEVRAAPIASVGFDGGSLRYSRNAMAEPRVADLSGGGDFEVLVATTIGWSEFVGVNTLRYGAHTGIVRFEDDGTHDVVPLGHPRQSPPSGVPVAPVLVHLDGDRRPEWVVARDNRLVPFGSGAGAALDEGWPDARGGAARRACVRCEAARVVDAPAVRSLAFEVEARPNPFNPRTVLRTTVPGPGPVEWDVYDTRGRHVRHEAAHADAAGVVERIFAGEDEAGRPLASGVYLVRARWNGSEAHARVVLVR